MRDIHVQWYVIGILLAPRPPVPGTSGAPALRRSSAMCARAARLQPSGNNDFQWFSISWTVKLSQISREIHEEISMDFHGFLWISWGFHEFHVVISRLNRINDVTIKLSRPGRAGPWARASYSTAGGLGLGKGGMLWRAVMAWVCEFFSLTIQSHGNWWGFWMANMRILWVIMIYDWWCSCGELGSN